MKFYSVYIRKYAKCKEAKELKQNRWIFSIAVLLFFSLPFTAYGEENSDATSGPGVELWKQDEVGWWMPQPNGGYAQNEWKQIHGEWYHFDDRGYMQTGWINDNGARYYLNESGAMVKNTSLTIEGRDYQFSDDGQCLTEVQVFDLPEGVKQPNNIIPEEEKSDIHRQVDAIADDILSRITNAAMSERQKAEAIYAWVRGNFRYAGHSASRDWPSEAYRSLRSHHGDCFSFYSAANALLSRAGIPSIEVIRSTDADHYWNLVRVDGNWYHFDTTPRSVGGYYCLWTDAQMNAFSNRHKGCFHFDASLYPRTP